MISLLSFTAMTTIKERLHKFNRNNTSMRTLTLTRKLQLGNTPSGRISLRKISNKKFTIQLDSEPHSRPEVTTCHTQVTRRYLSPEFGSDFDPITSSLLKMKRTLQVKKVRLRDVMCYSTSQN